MQFTKEEISELAVAEIDLSTKRIAMVNLFSRGKSFEEKLVEKHKKVLQKNVCSLSEVIHYALYSEENSIEALYFPIKAKLLLQDKLNPEIPVNRPGVITGRCVMGVKNEVYQSMVEIIIDDVSYLLNSDAEVLAVEK